MDFDALEPFLSPSRMNRYYVACGQSKVKAVQLYEIHLKICGAFASLLNFFEVVIRNAVHNALRVQFQQEDWIIQQKSGFMSDPSLRGTGFFIKREVERVENKLRPNRRVIRPGTIISNQNFGFWTAFFDSHHYRLIGGCTIRCFPLKPSTINRSQIAAMLNDIRRFRNRIYHNEPICFNATDISFEYAKSMLSNIQHLFNWINLEMDAYCEKIHNLNQLMAQTESMFGPPEGGNIAV